MGRWWRGHTQWPLSMRQCEEIVCKSEAVLGVNQVSSGVTECLWNSLAGESNKGLLLLMHGQFPGMILRK